MTATSLDERIGRDVSRNLRRVGSLLARARLTRTALLDIVTRTVAVASADLLALAERDAAARGDPEYAYESYLSFRAVLAYRTGHLIYLLHQAEGQDLGRRSLLSAARLITELAKVDTGIEIHPAAAIGPRLVVDHGFGTVIGEQVEIGPDCYILQNVTLGGRSIGRSSTFAGCRRHPRIGSRVEIGANAMVLGPVAIGDDCVLEPGVRVTCDVPPRSRVRLIASMQISLSGRSPRIHGLALLPDEIVICGSGLSDCRPVLIDGDLNPLSFLPVQAGGDTYINCRIPQEPSSLELSIGFITDDRVIGYVTPSLRPVRLTEG